MTRPYKALMHVDRLHDSQPEVQLPWKQRADGTPWIEKAETDGAPTPPNNPRDRDYYCGNRGNRDNDR